MQLSRHRLLLLSACASVTWAASAAAQTPCPGNRHLADSLKLVIHEHLETDSNRLATLDLITRLVRTGPLPEGAWRAYVWPAARYHGITDTVFGLARASRAARPLCASALIVLAYTLASRGQLDAATSLADTAVAQFPDSLGAWAYLAELAYQRGFRQRALQAYARVDALDSLFVREHLDSNCVYWSNRAHLDRYNDLLRASGRDTIASGPGVLPSRSGRPCP